MKYKILKLIARLDRFIYKRSKDKFVILFNNESDHLNMIHLIADRAI